MQRRLLDRGCPLYRLAEVAITAATLLQIVSFTHSTPPKRSTPPRHRGTIPSTSCCVGNISKPCVAGGSRQRRDHYAQLHPAAPACAAPLAPPPGAPRIAIGTIGTPWADDSINAPDLKRPTAVLLRVPTPETSAPSVPLLSFPHSANIRARRYSLRAVYSRSLPDANPTKQRSRKARCEPPFKGVENRQRSAIMSKKL